MSGFLIKGSIGLVSANYGNIFGAYYPRVCRFEKRNLTVFPVGLFHLKDPDAIRLLSDFFESVTIQSLIYMGFLTAHLTSIRMAQTYQRIF